MCVCVCVYIVAGNGHGNTSSNPNSNLKTSFFFKSENNKFFIISRETYKQNENYLFLIIRPDRM